MEKFLVPFSNGQAEIEEKKSKFIGKIIKVESEASAKEHIARIRKEHNTATHHCFAYIIKDENIERFSDDGEPQGTAGMPILSVIKNEEITNVLCVVIRYFGKILLGPGGLNRAYGQTAKKALLDAKIAQMLPFLLCKITVEYNMYDLIQKKFEDFTLNVEDCNYGEKIEVTFSVLKEEYKNLTTSITEITSGKVEVIKIKEEFKAKQILDSSI